MVISTKTYVAKYKKARALFRRRLRLLFPSVAEMELVRIMGGLVFTLPVIISTRKRFPLTFVVWRPALFRHEHIKREVRVGPYFVDFGNDIMRAIEVDGAAYHHDIVASIERDDYLKSEGWSVLHVSAYSVFRRPEQVREAVTKFLIQ